MARNDGISEREFARVEEETGLSKNEQLELLREQMAFSHNMGNRLMDLANRWEDAKQHRIAAKMADKQSIRDFKLAGRQLDLLEKVMAAHFAERKVMIEGGFRTIDKALAEGNWDAAAKVFGDMSAMVAQSPLAAAVELNNKMKSGKAITLDDF